MHGWYLQDRRRAVAWTWAFAGTRLLKEPEEKGHRAWRALFRNTTATALSPRRLPPPATPHLSQGRGLLVPAAAQALEGGGGEEPFDSNAGLRDYTSPSRAPLAPTPLVSPACARKMHPEGALLGRPQSSLQTLVGWEPPSPRAEEGGKGLRTARVGDEPQGPRPIPSSADPRKGLLSSPSQHFRIGGKEDWGGAGSLGTALKQCRSGVKRTPPAFPDPRKAPCPEGAHSPLHTQGSENPQLSTLFQPLPGKEKGDPDLPAKIWRGLREPPQNVLLRTLEAKRMGEGPGAGISDPPPWALGGLQEAPLSQPAIWPWGRGQGGSRGGVGGVQRQGDGHSDHREPEVPQTCCWEIKVHPNGCRVGRGPSPNPTISGIWPSGGLSVPQPPCSLGADGGAGPDGWC